MSTATSQPKRKTAESNKAFKFLSSLDDPLARFVEATGPVNAYEMHLPVVVRDPLEWLAFAITGQQISMAAAAAIYNRLIAALGGSVAVDAVLAASEETLLGVGLSHNKMRAVRALAEHVDDGRLEVDNFAIMTDAEIETELVAVPGIGPWSAQVFTMRYLQRPDVFPSGDLGVRHALTALDKLESRITPKVALARSEVFRPYRSYATQYLWKYAWALNHPTPEN